MRLPMTSSPAVAGRGTIHGWIPRLNPRMTTRGVAVFLLSTVCSLICLKPAQAASYACGPGQTCTLSADITLGGGDTLSWQGASGSRCVIQAAGHSVLSSNWAGALSIQYCDIYDLGGSNVA